MDREDNSATRKLAQQFLEVLAQIDKLPVLPADDVETVAAKLTRVLKPKPPELTIVPAVVSVLESISLIRAWSAQGFKLEPALANNVDLLGRHFLHDMVQFHEHYTHKKPPISRSSDFARLLAAAWQDLKFPGYRRDPEELADYLGVKLERVISRSRKQKTKSDCGR